MFTREERKNMEKTKDKLFASVYVRKDFGFGLIFFGLIFLINPQYGIIDILPDFVGLILIYSGMTKLADLDNRLFASRRSFFISLCLGAFSFASMIALLIFTFDSAANLTMSFFISIVSIIFFIPAFSKLLSGISYLKLRSEGSEEYIDDSEKKDSLKTFTIVFIVLKSVLNFAPELSELLRDFEDFRDVNLTTIKILITVISWVLVIALGIYWLISFKKYFNDLTSDETFMNYLHTRYDGEIGCDTHLMNIRKIKLFSILCMAAYILTLCLPSEGYHYMPEFLFGVIMFFAFKQASEYTGEKEEKKKMNLHLLLYTVSAIVMYVLRFIYSNNYAYNLYPFNPSKTAPLKFWIIYILVIIATVFTYYYMFKISRKMHLVRNTMIDKCVGLKNTDSKYRLELDEMRRGELKKKSKVVFIIQAVYAIASMVCMMLVPFREVLVAFGVYWAYRLVLCIVAIVAVYVIGCDLNDEAEKMI